MKDTQIKDLLNGKDLSKAEDLKAVTDAINNEFNSTVAKTEGSYKEKLDALKKENESLKANADLSSKQVKELTDKYAESSKQNDFLNKKAWVYKNINSKMDDEDMSDLFALTNSRLALNDKAKFEDVAKEVAKKRGFGQVTIAPAVSTKANLTTETTSNKKVIDSQESVNDFYAFLGKRVK